MKKLQEETIAKEQFGFRKQQRGKDQVLEIVESATQGFNRNQTMEAIFLDVGKAFGRVSNEDLIYKIRSLIGTALASGSNRSWT